MHEPIRKPLLPECDLNDAKMDSIESAYRERLMFNATTDQRGSLRVLDQALDSLEKMVGPDDYGPWSKTPKERIKMAEPTLQLALDAAANHLACCGVTVKLDQRDWERFVQVLPDADSKAHALNRMAARVQQIDPRYTLCFDPIFSAHDSGAAHSLGGSENLIMLSRFMVSYAFSQEDRSDSSLAHEVTHALNNKRIDQNLSGPYHGRIILKGGEFPFRCHGYESNFDLSELLCFRTDLNRQLINWEAARRSGNKLAMEHARVQIVEESRTGYRFSKNVLWVLDHLERSLVQDSGAKVQISLDQPGTVDEPNHCRIRAKFPIGNTEALLIFSLSSAELRPLQTDPNSQTSKIFIHTAQATRKGALSHLEFFESTYLNFRLNPLAKENNVA